MVKHFVEYQCYKEGEGIAFVEEEILKRNTTIALEKAPKNMLGYRFFDAKIKDEKTIIMENNKKAITPWTYEGTRSTVEELEAQKWEDRTTRIIVSLLKNNKTTEVVVTKFKQIIPLERNDRVVSEF